MLEKEISPKESEIVAQLPNGETVGSVVVSMSQNETAQIGYIFVRKKYRGNGWGSKLFEEASRWAQERGAKELTGALEPVPGCENALLSLLVKHGAEVKRGKFSKRLGSFER